MAGHASLFGVCALQFERRLLVVEVVFVPTGSHVATLAVLIGVIFFIQITHMHIGVAVDTGFADVPELPFFSLSGLWQAKQGVAACPPSRGSFALA